MPTPCSKYLLFLFDCESTGLDIYRDHILEIAAKVVNVSVSQPSYTSLVHTSRKISAEGELLPMCMLTQQNTVCLRGLKYAADMTICSIWEHKGVLLHAVGMPFLRCTFGTSSMILHVRDTHVHVDNADDDAF